MLFNDKELVDNWMSVVGEELYMSLRSTQIDIVGENIGVQHFLHDVRLVQHTEFNGSNHFCGLEQMHCFGSL
jgi:hypothetical protein